MIKDVWTIRTKDGGLDHYYSIQSESFITICGLVVNRTKDWFQFHATTAHRRALILLPPRVDTLRRQCITEPLNACQVCSEGMELVKLVRELGK